MRIKLIVVGKTDDTHIEKLILKYKDRLSRYKINFQMEIVSNLKNTKSLPLKQLKNKEEEMILSKISASDRTILLDEMGKQYTSIDFSAFLQHQMSSGAKQLVFIIGGAYGVSEELKLKVKEKIALSKMTFSHQMVRIFFIEQLYRALTIIRGEPYHHKD